MGAYLLLFSLGSMRLVPPASFLSDSSSQLSTLEAENSLWRVPAAVAGGASRCLAIRRLASDVPKEIAFSMPQPVKRSIAVLVSNGDRVLSVRRPNNDNELPGIWGLPAATYRGSETAEDVITRIGRDKLGVKLLPVVLRNRGTQERPQYRLEMELWEALMEGTPIHPEWRWAPVESLEPGAAAGSLCCELTIRTNDARKLKSRDSL